MAISVSISWSNDDENLNVELNTDTEGYNPDVADDMGKQIIRWLKESINDPTVVTPRKKTGEELESAGVLEEEESNEE